MFIDLASVNFSRHAGSKLRQHSGLGLAILAALHVVATANNVGCSHNGEATEAVLASCSAQSNYSVTCIRKLTRGMRHHNICHVRYGEAMTG